MWPTGKGLFPYHSIRDTVYKGIHTAAEYIQFTYLCIAVHQRVPDFSPASLAGPSQAPLRAWSTSSRLSSALSLLSLHSLPKSLHVYHHINHSQNASAPKLCLSPELFSQPHIHVTKTDCITLSLKSDPILST